MAAHPSNDPFQWRVWHVQCQSDKQSCILPVIPPSGRSEMLCQGSKQLLIYPVIPPSGRSDMCGVRWISCKASVCVNQSWVRTSTSHPSHAKSLSFSHIQVIPVSHNNPLIPSNPRWSMVIPSLWIMIHKMEQRIDRRVLWGMWLCCRDWGLHNTKNGDIHSTCKRSLTSRQKVFLL